MLAYPSLQRAATERVAQDKNLSTVHFEVVTELCKDLVDLLGTVIIEIEFGWHVCDADNRLWILSRKRNLELLAKVLVVLRFELDTRQNDDSQVNLV